MLTHLLSFEAKYHARQLTFGVAGALFLGLGILIAQGNFGSGDLHRNAPYVISYITCILSLPAIFVGTLFCAQVVLRDTTYDMNALLFTTTLRRWPYFFVRLSGLLLAVTGVLTLGVAGIFIGTRGADADTLGAFRSWHFLQPLLVFGIPNILLCCSILFSVALLTRQVRAVYITGVSLFILYFLGSILGNSPLMASSSLKSQETQLLPNLLDPFGITSFFGSTRHWTVEERNTRLLPLTGYFLINRLTWTLLATIVLLFTWYRFAFRLPVAGSTQRQRQSNTTTPAATIPYHTVTANPIGFTYHLRAWYAQWRLESGAIFRHIPFLVLLALWAFLTAVDLKETILHGPYNIRFYTATGYIVDYLRPMRPALLLIVFYAGELIHRERGARMHELIFATPVSNTVLWWAKTAALGSLIGALVAVNVLTGIAFQLAQGYHPIEWSSYLSLFWYSGWPLLLYAVLILFVQALFRNKYAGMLVSLAVVGVFLLGNRLGLHSYLVRYAATPLPEYAYMSGWGHESLATQVYLLYWTAIAGLLLMLGAAVWQTREPARRGSFLQRRSPFRLSGTMVGAVLCVLISLGTALYVQLAPGNHLPVGKARQRWQAAYEKQFRLRASLPQPVITRVQLKTDLYPHQRRYTVQGQYWLHNQSAAPIATLWLGRDVAVSSIRYTLPNARRTEEHAQYGLSQYTLNSPLQPGDSTMLSFSMEVRQSPFSPFNSEHAIVGNGSYVELEKYLPYLGYQPWYELEDVQVRKQQGLAPQVQQPASDSAYHLISMDHIISTEPDQQVVSTGIPIRDWGKRGRRYFHFRTDHPIAFKFAFSSARYTLHRAMHGDIVLNIWYPADLSHNVPVIAQAMGDALEYGKTQWGPYPFRQLTLAAIPHYPGAATAYPGVLFSAERISFMSNLTDTSRFNSVYAVTAHEVAHQWWANALAPLDAPGRAVLTESLAKYGEYMVVENRFGTTYLRWLLQQDNNLYFALRGLDNQQEQPLYRSDQPYVYYQKGGLTLYGTKELMGETYVNAALRQLIARHGYPRTKGRPDDLLLQLKAGATPQQAAQMTAWFTEVVTYDNAITTVRCDTLPGNCYRLTVSLRCGSTNQGKSTTPFPYKLPVAVYAAPPVQWNRATQPLHYQQYSISSQHPTLIIEVTERPAVVMIDPMSYLLDADLSDNLYMINATTQRFSPD